MPKMEREAHQAMVDAQINKARLEALILVAKALDQNSISKRNLTGIDRQIASDIQSYVLQLGPNKKTLPEEIQRNSGAAKSSRDLPLPAHTRWDSKRGLLPCQQYKCDTLEIDTRAWLTEPERWDNLPEEFKEEENACNHAVFFEKHSAQTQQPSSPADTEQQYQSSKEGDEIDISGSD